MVYDQFAVMEPDIDLYGFVAIVEGVKERVLMYVVIM